MKSMIVLTTALFLVSAPSPDSKTISEFSAGFLIDPNVAGLMDSEAVAAMGSQTSTYAWSLANEPVLAELPNPSAAPATRPLAEQSPVPVL